MSGDPHKKKQDAKLVSTQKHELDYQRIERLRADELQQYQIAVEQKQRG